jgi:hypothetical protein
MGEFCLLYLLCMLPFPVPQTIYTWPGQDNSPAQALQQPLEKCAAAARGDHATGFTALTSTRSCSCPVSVLFTESTRSQVAEKFLQPEEWGEALVWQSANVPCLGATSCMPLHDCWWQPRSVA